jgi:hypothetical protein
MSENGFAQQRFHADARGGRFQHVKFKHLGKYPGLCGLSRLHSAWIRSDSPGKHWSTPCAWLWRR